MKLIKVDCCGHCPLRERQNYFDNFCTNSATDGMELTDLSIIHPDCPLEDAKGENNE